MSLDFPYERGRIEIRVNNVIFRSISKQHCHICLKSHVFFQAFSQHGAIRKRMATRFFGAKKIAAALGVPEATTKRWRRRLRSDGDMASRNIGRPRGAEAGVCVWCSVHVPSHICFRDLCVLSLGPLIKSGTRSCHVTHR